MSYTTIQLEQDDEIVVRPTAAAGGSRMEVMLRFGPVDGGVLLYMGRDVAERLRDTLHEALTERPDGGA